MNKEILIKVNNLKKYFPIKAGIVKKTVGYVKAVDDVSLEIHRGETIGIVGESGCGKTTFGKTVLQLHKATSGSVEYLDDGKYVELTKLSEKEMDIYRKKMQIVFQDPYSSLNPAFTIYGSLSEPLQKFGIKNKEERIKIIGDLLEEVNLPKDYMSRYPNEFSGGQLQRIGIARALCVKPECIILDEPVSALDVSIQAQVLQLLIDLKNERNLTYFFISHDLSVVEYIADRVVVMYLGKIVEMAETEELFNNPLHPYTDALLSAIPVADVNKTKTRKPLQGDVPSPSKPPLGCHFHPRCPMMMERCKKEVPELKKYEINGVDHYCSCHLIDQKFSSEFKECNSIKQI